MIGRADYEERKEARIERMRNRAAAKAAEATQASQGAMQILGCIPPGQPILVGHHSERRHRRDLARVDANFRRASEAEKEAQDLARRADAAEDNGAISSDDPKALDKLRAKLAHIESNRAKAVIINKTIRGAKGDAAKAVAALQALGYSPEDSANLLKPDFCGRIGIPDYALTNWSAEARRIKARIATLEARSVSEPKPDEQIGDVKIIESDNRVQIIFPGKPDEAVRAKLKSNGFRWSPMAGAWQRMPSAWAWHVAREIATSLV